MSGVTGIMESLDSVEGIVDLIEKIMADGKITLLDAKYLPKLFLELKTGFDDFGELKEEIEDLDKEELQEVLSRIIDIVLKVAGKFTTEAPSVPEGGV